MEGTMTFCTTRGCFSLMFERAPPKTHGRDLKGLIQCAKVAFWLDEVIMETSALGQSASDRYPQIASPIHTILVLAVLGGWGSGIRFLRIN
jgi:hypothetical protein